MITDKDVEKIKNALMPEIDAKLDAQSKNFNSKLDSQSKSFDAKLDAQTKEIKEYIHEGVNDVIDGVDNLFREHLRVSHVGKLEKITPN